MKGFWSIFFTILLLLLLALSELDIPKHTKVPLDFYNKLAQAAKGCMDGNCIEENGTICVSLAGVNIPWGGTTLPDPEVGKVCWR